MAARSDGHHDNSSDNDDASSQPLTEQTTTSNTKKHRFTTTSTPTLQQTLDATSLSSSKQLPQIPFDLISSILLKLPVKSLLRFRSVCKSWNALISDPKFAKQQFRASPVDPTHSTRNHLMEFIGNRSDEFIVIDFSLPAVFNSSIVSSSRRKLPHSVEGKNFHFLAGPCHGMLLLCYRNCAVLWNPATGKSQKLPPLENSLAYGVGYDRSSDIYKVVAVVTCALAAGDYPEWDPRVMVHTLGTDSWREVQGFPSSVSLMYSAGKFVSGALNWLAKDNTSGDDSKIIGCLDLVTETYHQLLLPLDCQGDFQVLSLEVLKGCLCILSHHKLLWDVWLMKEYRNMDSWTKVFSYPNNAEFPKYIPYTSRMLCMSDDDGELLLNLDEEVVVYNAKSRTFRTTTRMKSFGCGIVAVVYAASLISP